MKIILCGETYSANLGDPIIAASLREILRRVDPQLEVEFLDMSGRAPGPAQRDVSAVPTRLQRWNRRLRARGRFWQGASNLLHWQIRGRSRLQAACAEAFSTADAVVIGGGQLLMDNELDFPHKVGGLVAAAQLARLPVALHACGVGTRWSAYGHRLVAEALARPSVVSLSVRDEESLRTLRERFPHAAAAPQLCLDPALWAAEAYGLSREADADSVGIAVMDPKFMRPHLRAAGRADDDTWSRFWRDVVRHLLAKGRRVELLTNGAAEDEIFADRIVRGIGEPRLHRIPRPVRSEELVATIARQSALVCTRLHAGIIAYSLGVPTVAVRWDEKVPSFARATGREEFCFDPDGGLDPTVLLQLLQSSLKEGVDCERRSDIKDSCISATRSMVQLLAAATARGGGAS